MSSTVITCVGSKGRKYEVVLCDDMKMRYEALQREYAEAKKSPKSSPNIKYKKNLEERKVIKDMIAEQDTIIKAKKPGTINKAKQKKRALMTEYETLVAISGTYFNGGVW